MGKSKAQDALMHDLQEYYPASYISNEVYIGDLIKERGYTIDEIKAELGHKPHKMFVDIVMRDSDSTIAFEYHGEQHYGLVGNMTKTTADLLVNQNLDREKSWILQRIGIPLVAIPFDMYVDEAIIDDLIVKATDECIESISSMSRCACCERNFPAERLGGDGICKSCAAKAKQEKNDAIEEQISERKTSTRAKRAKARKRERQEAREKERMETRERKRRARSSRSNAKSFRQYIDDGSNSCEESDYEKDAKERAKQRRKEQYEAWKRSPEYAAQKEENKRKRKEEYQRMKAERKKRGR